MQSNSFYIYDNKVQVQLTTDPLTPQRYKIVYARTIKLYKGTDNTIKFECKNSDQKKVNIADKNVTLNILDDTNGATYFSIPCDMTNANVGIITATIPSYSLIDMNRQNYNYSLAIDDGISTYVTYVDDSYNARGQVEIISGYYPEFKKSIDVSIPTIYDPDISGVISSTVQSELPSGRNNLHTAQLFFDNFTGSVAIQATLDTVLPSGNTSPTNYFTISSTDYTNRNVTDIVNFEGAYSFVRFLIQKPDNLSGNVTTILYRS